MDIDEMRKASDDRLWEKLHEEHRCEECGGNSGEEVVTCLGSDDEVYPSTCLACKEDVCVGRGNAFKCDCGHLTREEMDGVHIL